MVAMLLQMCFSCCISVNRALCTTEVLNNKCKINHSHFTLYAKLMFCLYVLCKIKVLNNFELESTRIGISSEGETFSSIDFATGPS